MRPGHVDARFATLLTSFLVLAQAACGSTECPEPAAASSAAAPAVGGTEPRPPALPFQVGELTRDERTGLRPAMIRHGETMQDLLWASLMLDIPSVTTIASWVEEGILASPDSATGDAGTFVEPDSETDPDYPVTFVWLQARLARDAQALARASLEGDRAKIAAAYGRVAEGCIRCHAIYLTRSPSEAGRPAAAP